MLIWSLKCLLSMLKCMLGGMKGEKSENPKGKRVFISFIIIQMHHHLAICYIFQYTLPFLPSADACHMHRDHEDPCYAEEASKHPLRVPGLMTACYQTQKHQKLLYSCPADTAPFTQFAKATNLFVPGSTQALQWVNFHYYIKILIS